MDAACASVESPLDSRKDIIAQLLCLMQRSLMPEFQVSASSVHQSGFGSRRAEDNSLTSGLPTILELAGASSASTVIPSQTRNHMFVLCCRNPESQCEHPRPEQSSLFCQECNDLASYSKPSSGKRAGNLKVADIRNT